MAGAKYPYLLKPESRWRLLAEAGHENDDDIIVDKKHVSFVAALRDIPAGPKEQDAFFETLRALPPDNELQAAFARSFKGERKRIAYDYLRDDEQPKKRRRIDIIGNYGAGTLLAGYDETIALGRTAYKIPDDLDEPFDRLFDIYLRRMVFGPEKLMDYARCWTEVRYRFLNHCLRDDPQEWFNFSTGPRVSKGTTANQLIHKSNVKEDARVVEFKRVKQLGFDDKDRALFEQVYLLSPEHGRQLATYCEDNAGLRAGLPNTFRYCADFIDAYLNWRIQLLEAARQRIFNDPAVVAASNHQQRDKAIQPLLRANERKLKAADTAYGDRFIPNVIKLLDEARQKNALYQSTWDELDKATDEVIRRVKTCALNNIPGLANNVSFARVANDFPGLGIDLPKPSGSALITERKPPAPRGKT
ncbi:hypothetical protein F5Y17DRAFT_218352 [Xylariaceae sp. FL0594]|nr:hypothetical protein F5Y17DRAFT_218352 [Xylariaceae sp. FL0594]